MTLAEKSAQWRTGYSDAYSGRDAQFSANDDTPEARAYRIGYARGVTARERKTEDAIQIASDAYDYAEQRWTDTRMTLVRRAEDMHNAASELATAVRGRDRELARMRQEDAT